MTTQKQNAPTGGRSVCWNLGGSIRNRIAASRRLEPLQCGCRDPWLCQCRRPTLTAESVLASVVHLNGHGSWTTADLRRAWAIADTDDQRTLIEATARRSAA